MSDFHTATARGLAALKRHCGVPVTLTRGIVSIDVTAIRGSTTAEVEALGRGDDSQRIRTFRRDYLIDVVDYDFGSGPAEPAIGDKIADGGSIYEVCSLGSGEPPWRWHDRSSVRYRVHTVEI
ncbi:MAG: hypothetical protein WBC44_15075 [Planctomycetaceae bacterium]